MPMLNKKRLIPNDNNKDTDIIQNPTIIGNPTFQYVPYFGLSSFIALAIEGDTNALTADPNLGKLKQTPKAI